MEHELSRTTLANAIERARVKRCRVRPLGWRVYSVTSLPKGHTYTVRFFIRDGRKYGSCNCASLVPCVHVASAAQAHCMIAAMKAEFEPLCQETPRLGICADCGEPTGMANSICTPCWHAATDPHPLAGVLVGTQLEAGRRMGGIEI